MGDENANEALNRALHSLSPEIPAEPKKAPPPEAHSTVKNTDPSVLTGPAAREVVRQQQSEARRFAAVVSTFQIPEQVAGSSHEFEIPLPLNLDPKGNPVDTMLVIEGEDMEPVSAGPTIRSVAGPMPAKADLAKGRIRFSPKRTGAYRGTLRIAGDWPDGHSEKVEVAILASSRWIDQAPQHPSTIEPPVRKPDDVSTTATRDPEPDDLPTLDILSKQVQHRIEAIHKHQSGGIDIVEKEARKYIPPAPPESVWAILVELAVTMGTAAIANVAGALVSRAIVTAAHKLIPATAHTLVEEGLATAVEDGLKDSVGVALRRRLKGGEGEAHAHEEGETGSASTAKSLSSDTQIAFFARLFESLISLETAHKDHADAIASGLAKKHGAESVVARQGLMAIVDGLNRIGHTANEKQAAATAPQWVSYVARAEHGAVEVEGPAGPITATKLNVLRGTAEKRAPATSAGVLDIFVNASEAPFGASLTGVSQNIADRLLGADLNHTQIPIRFRLGPTTITRDEAGRVRISQWLDPGSNLSEVQRVAFAERVVARILEKPLAAWGLSEIHTDDQKKT